MQFFFLLLFLQAFVIETFTHGYHCLATHCRHCDSFSQIFFRLSIEAELLHIFTFVVVAGFLLKFGQRLRLCDRRKRFLEIVIVHSFAFEGSYGTLEPKVFTLGVFRVIFGWFCLHPLKPFKLVWFIWILQMRGFLDIFQFVWILRIPMKFPCHWGVVGILFLKLEIRCEMKKGLIDFGLLIPLSRFGESCEIGFELGWKGTIFVDGDVLSLFIDKEILIIDMIIAGYEECLRILVRSLGEGAIEVGVTFSGNFHYNFILRY